MAIAVRSASQAQGEGVTSLSCSLPAGYAAGDLLLAIRYSDYSSTTGAVLTAPAGWTTALTVGTASGSFQPVLKVFWKIALGSEGSTAAFGGSSASSSVVGILALTGFNTTTPITTPVATGVTTNGTSHPAPSVTGVVDGLLVTGHAADFFTATSDNSYTPPSGMTERVDMSAQFTYMGMNTLPLTTTAATGTKAATANRSSQDPHRSVSLVVNPAPAAVVRPLFLPF